MSMWIPGTKEFGGRRPCLFSVDGTRSVIDRQADDSIMWQNCGARGGWHSLGSRTSTRQRRSTWIAIVRPKLGFFRRPFILFESCQRENISLVAPLTFSSFRLQDTGRSDEPKSKKMSFTYIYFCVWIERGTTEVKNREVFVWYHPLIDDTVIPHLIHCTALLVR